MSGRSDGRDGREMSAEMSLQLCRLYHCTPLELDKQPLDVVLGHIACVVEENRQAKIEQARQQARARSGRRRR